MVWRPFSAQWCYRLGVRMQNHRRRFLKSVAAGGAALGAPFGSPWPVLAADAVEAGASNVVTPPTTRNGDMQYRILGRTGEKVSIVGLGGSHIGKQKDEQESIRIIRSAIDRGITFM